jgi:hypothetical protein
VDFGRSSKRKGKLVDFFRQSLLVGIDLSLIRSWEEQPKRTSLRYQKTS